MCTHFVTNGPEVTIALWTRTGHVNSLLLVVKNGPEAFVPFVGRAVEPSEKQAG